MEEKIFQVVDSSGGLSQDFLKEYSIAEVPFYFKFENTDYLKENIDYTAIEFFEHMELMPEDVPKTSVPNPYDWLSAFERQYSKGARKFIVTTISSKLSTSFEAANLGKQMLEEKYDDIEMEIIDSKTCASGQAALEIWIAGMIKEDKAFDEIVKRAREMIPNLNTIFVVDSLKYMNAGGRIGGAAAFLGKLINIKPISEFVDGEVKVVKPIIGRKKSLEAMVDVALGRIDNIHNAIITIQNALAQEDGDYVYDYLRENASHKTKIISSDLGITVGAHSGPGTVGIGFLED